MIMWGIWGGVRGHCHGFLRQLWCRGIVTVHAILAVTGNVDPYTNLYIYTYIYIASDGYMFMYACWYLPSIIFFFTCRVDGTGMVAKKHLCLNRWIYTIQYTQRMQSDSPELCLFVYITPSHYHIVSDIDIIIYIYCKCMYSPQTIS